MSKYKRVVVKIGSSTITHETGMINLRQIEKIVKVLSDIKNSGVELVFVTSGAIPVGCGKLGFKSKPEDMASKQAAAAVGQCELMYIYDKLFSEYNHIVSQVLLTNDDFVDDVRRTFVENTLTKLIELGCIPIINENDTVSVKEIEAGVFSENDELSAIVCQLINADLLVLVSDIDGLYDSNPKINPNATLIPVVSDYCEAEKYASGTFSKLGTGGMNTKIKAASLVTSTGSDAVILNGDNPDNFYLAVEGRPIGTFFPSKEGGNL